MSTIKSSAENLTLNADGANNDIKFQSNGVEKASIDHNGKVTAGGASLDGAVVFNESGADVDFRVESDDNASMLFVDGGNDRIGIGTNSPGVQVEIVDAIEPRLKLRNSVTPDGTKYGGILDLQLGSGGGGGSGNDDTQDGDRLGVINFLGQGTDYAYQGAAIMAEVQTGDGTATRTEQGVELQFHTMPTTSTGYAKRWTIDQDGDLIPANTAHGIVLGATSNVDANTLDDYEEGTFTPTMDIEGSGTVTLSASYGYYVKIGSFVSARLDMQVSAISGAGGSNAWEWGGLPFAVHSGSSGYVPISGIRVTGMSTNPESLTGFIIAGSSGGRIEEQVAGTNNSSTFLSSTTRVQMTFIYQV